MTKDEQEILQDIQTNIMVNMLLSMSRMSWAAELTRPEALRTAAYALRVAREKAADQ